MSSYLTSRSTPMPGEGLQSPLIDRYDGPRTWGRDIATVHGASILVPQTKIKDNKLFNRNGTARFFQPGSALDVQQRAAIQARERAEAAGIHPPSESARRENTGDEGRISTATTQVQEDDAVSESDYVDRLSGVTSVNEVPMQRRATRPPEVSSFNYAVFEVETEPESRRSKLRSAFKRFKTNKVTSIICSVVIFVFVATLGVAIWVGWGFAHPKAFEDQTGLDSTPTLSASDASSLASGYSDFIARRAANTMAVSTAATLQMRDIPSAHIQAASFDVESVMPISTTALAGVVTSFAAPKTSTRTSTITVSAKLSTMASTCVPGAVDGCMGFSAIHASQSVFSSKPTSMGVSTDVSPDTSTSVKPTSMSVSVGASQSKPTSTSSTNRASSSSVSVSTTTAAATDGRTGIITAMSTVYSTSISTVTTPPTSIISVTTVSASAVATSTVGGVCWSPNADKQVPCPDASTDSPARRLGSGLLGVITMATLVILGIIVV